MQHVFHPSPTCSNRKFGMLAGHSANNPQKTRSVTFELLKAHKKWLRPLRKYFVGVFVLHLQPKMYTKYLIERAL